MTEEIWEHVSDVQLHTHTHAHTHACKHNTHTKGVLQEAGDWAGCCYCNEIHNQLTFPVSAVLQYRGVLYTLVSIKSYLKKI